MPKISDTVINDIYSTVKYISPTADVNQDTTACMIMHSGYSKEDLCKVTKLCINNLNHFNRRTEFLRSRATQIVEFLNNFVFIRNNRNNDNIDNIISHIMLHDPNKYGNPPAAKKAVENLKKYKITKEKIKEFGFENSCAVCKDEFIIDEECLSMPCNHNFHKDCIIPWLKERNSCPICRYELPTDDKDFEERKKLKLKKLKLFY